MRAKTGEQPRPVLDLLEAAFHLLRLAPRRAIAGYFVGTLPFMLAWLFFWSDMARGAHAETRLAPGAALLAMLFVWMKTWHALYAADLLAFLRGDPLPPLGLRRLARVAQPDMERRSDQRGEPIGIQRRGLRLARAVERQHRLRIDRRHGPLRSQAPNDSRRAVLLVGRRIA